MWWRRCLFSLNGTIDSRSRKGALSYATQLLNTNQPIRAPRSLMPHVIYDADGLCPFEPPQRSGELLDPCFEGLQVGRELCSPSNRFRVAVALPVAEEPKLEDHTTSFNRWRRTLQLRPARGNQNRSSNASCCATRGLACCGSSRSSMVSNPGSAPRRLASGSWMNTSSELSEQSRLAETITIV